MESSNQVMQFKKSDFTRRLKLLIGEGSISAFARKVDLGESLIRKYLKGSDPGLSKVVKIAVACDVSIEWLVLGNDKV